MEKIRKVNNTKLNSDLKYDIDRDLLYEFNLSVKDYKKTIESLLGYGVTSFVYNMLARKSSIGSNTIENIIVDEDVLESELAAKSKVNKNEDKLKTVINFLNFYSIREPFDFENLSSEIKNVHSKLFKGITNAKAGKFKKLENYIPGTKKFLEPRLVIPELSKLEGFVNNSVFEPIAIAAIAHAKFIEIHPFSDGNGRVGRLFANKLIEHFYKVPLWIDEAMSMTLTQYISALDNFSFDGDATGIVNYFISMSIQQMNRNSKLIGDLVDKTKTMHDSIEVPIEICMYINSNRVVNVSGISKEFNIHRNTAKSYLDKAKDNGYMETIEKGKTLIYKLK